MAADQLDGQGRSAGLDYQVRAPTGMLFSHNKWQMPSVRCPMRPAPCSLSEKKISQHNYGPIEDGNGHQDFTHIVQKCGCQQVRCCLPGSFQQLEKLISMQLFRRLHAPEKNQLCRCKVGEQRFARYALSWTEQGVPELAGAVSKAGYI